MFTRYFYLITHTAMLAVFTYALVSFIDVERKNSLAKNIQWVKNKLHFQNRYLKPSALWVPITAGLLLMFFIIDFFFHWSIISNTKHELLHMAFFFVSAGIIVLRETYINNRIPLPDSRHASLTPRTMDKYIPRPVIYITLVWIILIYLNSLILFLSETISVHRFAANILSHSLCYAIAFWALLIVKKDKAISPDVLKIAGHPDLESVVRRTNYGIVLTCFLFFNILFISQVAGQYFGMELCIQPYKSFLPILGSDEALKPLIHPLLYYFLKIWALITIFLIIPNTSLYTRARKIKMENILEKLK